MPPTASAARKPRLFVPWLVLATTCCVVMWVTPGGETIPYHVAWIGVALAYGFDPWSLRRTVVAIGLYTFVTGAILVQRAIVGSVAWDETAEIPLMSILVVLSVWHVRRREFARAELAKVAARDRARAEQRERLNRLTSHEMRTPLTIATGYLDLLLGRRPDPETRADLEVVQDELGRLTRAGERLLRMIHLDDGQHDEVVDIDALFRQVADRWSTVVDRCWTVDSTAGTQLVSAERLRACLDTLIENALRYTGPGDAIRLTAFRDGDTVCLGVADSGPGLPGQIAAAVNAQDFTSAQQLSRTSHSGQTGLGLGLVHEMVDGSGGRVVAGRAAEGGALVLMAMPAVGPTGARRTDERVSTRNRPLVS
jgi:two-component system, OmpR family, sensor kinase